MIESILGLHSSKLFGFGLMPSTFRDVEIRLNAVFTSSLFVASFIAAMFTLMLRLIKKSYKKKKEIRHAPAHKAPVRQEASSSPSSRSPARTCSSPEELDSPLRLAWHRKMSHTSVGRTSNSNSPVPSSSGARFYANIVAKQQMVVQLSTQHSPSHSDDCTSPYEMRPRRMSHDCNPFRPTRTASSQRRGEAWDVMADFGRLRPGDHVEHENSGMVHPGLWETMHAHHRSPSHVHSQLEQPGFEELASTSFGSSAAERYFDEWVSLEEQDRHSPLHSPLRRSPTYPPRRKSIY
mmetsp:Transcript_25724/g.57844  ORF Transcript_25724/g.57844 Transcript_25724/m.57844 type:complete len:293 (-) Transcript_25724:92-970(-)|eukprot:752806-Hanusia_phi.AAC.2